MSTKELSWKTIHKLYYWCNKVLPAVYDESLSYYEVLNKMAYKLNDLISNYNQLPDYIVDEIKEYVEGDTLREILQEVISNFMLNVKFAPEGIPSAVGDGATDDTEAIQGCIDFCSENGGGCVFIPNGAYLTDSLVLPVNVSIVGNDRYKTIFTLKGGASAPLVTAQGSNTIAGITLNGNVAAQTNYQDCVYATGEDHLIQNVILRGGNYGLESNATGHLQVSDVIVPTCVVAGVYTHGSEFVQMTNVTVETVSAVEGEASYVINTNNGSFRIASLASVDECVLIGGSNNYVVIRNVNGVKAYTDNGTGNQIHVEGSIDNITLARLNSMDAEFETQVTQINAKIEENENYPIYNATDETFTFLGSLAE